MRCSEAGRMSGAAVLILIRVQVGVMLLVTLSLMVTMRANMSINILAMVQSSTRGGCGGVDNSTNMEPLPDYGPRYAWSPYQQSLLLGAFFWGYGSFMIPGGILTDRFRLARLNLGGALLLTSLLTIGTPWLAAADSFAVMLASRIAIGILSGCCVPCMHALVASWSPPGEKSRFVCTLTGMDLGALLAWLLCGVVIESHGWAWSFYGNGLVGLFCAGLWFYIVRAAPAQHPRITHAELTYIEAGQSGGQQRGTTSRRWPPLGRIVRCGPFWLAVCTQFGHMWGWNFLLTSAPRFLYEVLGYELAWTGALAAGTHLGRPVAGVAFGMAADRLVQSGRLSVGAVRKWMMGISHVLAGLCLLTVGLVPTDGPYTATICVAIIVASTILNGSAFASTNQLPQDLAPNFAASVSAIINMVASTSGFLAPMLVAWMTAERNGMAEWSLLFGVVGALYIGTATLFICFGSAEVQPWNSDGDERKEHNVDACVRETRVQEPQRAA